MAPRRHQLRSWIEGMFRRGELVTRSEGAAIASVPRQTVGRWLKEAGIDPEVMRQRFIARNQAKAQRHAAGLPPLGKPTKKQLRAIADKAVRRWNAANAKADAGQPRPARARRGVAF